MKRLTYIMDTVKTSFANFFFLILFLSVFQEKMKHKHLQFAIFLRPKLPANTAHQTSTGVRRKSYCHSHLSDKEMLLCASGNVTLFTVTKKLQWVIAFWKVLGVVRVIAVQF